MQLSVQISFNRCRDQHQNQIKISQQQSATPNPGPKSAFFPAFGVHRSRNTRTTSELHAGATCIADWAIVWITNGLFWCVMPLICIFSLLRVLDLCIPPLQVTLYVHAPQSVHSTGNLLVTLIILEIHPFTPVDYHHFMHFFINWIALIVHYPWIQDGLF